MLPQMLCKERSFLVEQHNKVDVEVITSVSSQHCSFLSYLLSSFYYFPFILLCNYFSSTIILHWLHRHTIWQSVWIVFVSHPFRFLQWLNCLFHSICQRPRTVTMILWGDTAGPEMLWIMSTLSLHRYTLGEHIWKIWMKNKLSKRVKWEEEREKSRGQVPDFVFTFVLFFLSVVLFSSHISSCFFQENICLPTKGLVCYF